MARLWTPRELLERGELEPGETVLLDVSGEISIGRSGGPDWVATIQKTPWLAANLYFARRTEKHGYLHAGGSWRNSTAGERSSGAAGRDDYTGYFDTLPELLDALFVATLREESSRTPEATHANL
jgi:hypothetical protein